MVLMLETAPEQLVLQVLAEPEEWGQAAEVEEEEVVVAPVRPRYPSELVSVTHLPL